MIHILHELDRISRETVNAEKFLALVKKYTDFSELTPAMINEFVEKILVHQAEGKGASRTQEVEIFFNFIGKVEIPRKEIELTEEEKAALAEQERRRAKKAEYNRRYMEKKLAELAEYNANRASDLDERRLTNIGTFREYMEQWIESNPDINQDMTHMVRQLQPGPTGLPLEIYCFSAKQRWIDYENVQSDLFDHVYAVMPLFNLRAFQYSGEVAAQEQ